MSLLKALFTCAYVVTAMGFPQTSRPNYLPLSNVTRNSRAECALVKSLKDVIPNCSNAVLRLNEDNSYFETEGILLCFGVYDTYYELCQVNANQTDIVLPKYEAKGFCIKAKAAFENYKLNRSDPVLSHWASRLKNTVANLENCTNICVFNKKEVNHRCERIVWALEVYSDTTKRDSFSKIPVVQLAGQSLNKTSIPSGSKESKEPSPVLSGKDVASSVVANPSMTSSVGKSDGANPVLPSQDVANEQATQSKPNASSNGAGISLEQPQSSSLAVAEDDSPKPENMGEGPASKLPMPTNDDDDAEEQPPEPPGEPRDDAPAIKFPDSEMDTGDKNGMQQLMASKFDDDEESNLVTYFILMTGGALLFYVAFHNKNKLLALALEGRRTNRRGGRHSSAAYSKLHSNLEEAIAAGPTSPSATHVLY